MTPRGVENLTVKVMAHLLHKRAFTTGTRGAGGAI